MARQTARGGRTPGRGYPRPDLACAWNFSSLRPFDSIGESGSRWSHEWRCFAGRRAPTPGPRLIDDLGALVSILDGNPNFVSEDMQSGYSVVEMKSATLLAHLHPVIPVILISVGYFRSMSLISPPISVDRIPETVTVCSSLSTSQGLSIPISKLEAVGPRIVTAGSRFSQACRKALTSG